MVIVNKFYCTLFFHQTIQRVEHLSFCIAIEKILYLKLSKFKGGIFPKCRTGSYWAWY